jgi:acetone carboxylase gamma subunit
MLVKDLFLLGLNVNQVQELLNYNKNIYRTYMNIKSNYKSNYTNLNKEIFAYLRYGRDSILFSDELYIKMGEALFKINDYHKERILL